MINFDQHSFKSLHAEGISTKGFHVKGDQQHNDIPALNLLTVQRGHQVFKIKPQSGSKRGIGPGSLRERELIG